MSANKNAELKRDDVESTESSKPAAKTRRRHSGGGPDDVSRALRTAYDDTIREQVPDEFLDLLGKLS